MDWFKLEDIGVSLYFVACEQEKGPVPLLLLPFLAYPSATCCLAGLGGLQIAFDLLGPVRGFCKPRWIC